MTHQGQEHKRETNIPHPITAPMYRHGVATTTADPWPHLTTTSRNDAARRLGIAPDTLDRWAQRGTIRVIRINGRTLVPITELERLISPPSPPSPPSQAMTHDDAWSRDHDDHDTTT
jgi:hypothetical protein